MSLLNYSNIIDPFLKEIREQAVEILEINQGDRILDVCCGTGDQVFYYAREGVEAVGIDLNSGMIELKNKA